MHFVIKIIDVLCFFEIFLIAILFILYNNHSPKEYNITSIPY